MVCMVSCSDDDNDGIPSKARQTIIIYISGENSLSSLVQNDLNEITIGSDSVSKDVNIVAFVDRSSSSELPFIAQFKDGKMTIDDKLAMSEDVYASDPSVILKTLNNIIHRYKADTYSLILWGHASGWYIEKDTIPTKVSGIQMAYGVDNGSNSSSNIGKWINIPTLASVLKSTGIKFDFILADCCCFQNIETAYELKDVADYIIGSPAEIPGGGAPYHKLLPIMSKDMDTEQKCISIADTYYLYYSYSKPSPMSVIRTDRLQPLAEVTRMLWQTIKDKDLNGKGCTYYFLISYRPIFYDAKEIVAANVDDQSLTAEWNAAFDQAVVYHKASKRWSTIVDIFFSSFSPDDDKSSCVSMYLPLTSYGANKSTFSNQVMNYVWGQTIFGQ